MMIIPKGTFEEITKDVEVEVLFPFTQIDEFPIKNNGEPSTSDKTTVRIGVLISTTYNNEIYYIYNVFYSHHIWNTNKNFIEKIEKQLKSHVLKHI